MALKMGYVKFIFIIFIGFLSIAAAPIPQGWRNPTEQETNQSWRKESKYRYLSVRLDFNEDGIVDEAKLLVNQNSKGLGLFVFISKGKDWESVLLDQSGDAFGLDIMGIDLAEKGKYKTACGKEYFPCGPGVSKELELQFPGLYYFKGGGSSSFFYWDKGIGTLKRVQISD